jgi:hypothetical protein
LISEQGVVFVFEQLLASGTIVIIPPQKQVNVTWFHFVLQPMVDGVTAAGLEIVHGPNAAHAVVAPPPTNINAKIPNFKFFSIPNPFHKKSE